MSATILIKNGTVIDPGRRFQRVTSLLVEDGKIVALGSKAPKSASTTFDAKGKWVLPGLIDLHVHFRDPGRSDVETIASGSRAAALGGFTTVLAMPNTEPPIDSESMVRGVISKARSEAIIHVRTAAAITVGQKGEKLTEMGRLVSAGASAFSDDGKTVPNSSLMRRALEYAGQWGVPVIDHCEDPTLSNGGVMNEGALSSLWGLPGVPKEAEEVIVARNIALAERFGPIHLTHVSSAGSVELIRYAKRRKIPVTADTCPHYFSLTEEAIEGYNTFARVNPPLKTEKDRIAVIAGIADGTLDTICTDHAPHAMEDKEVEFVSAKPGMVGLETALGLVISKLIASKKVSLMRALEALTSAPAKVLKLKKGSLAEGSDADVIIVDPKKNWKVDPDKFATRSRNTPFSGWDLTGKVETTIVGGRVVVDEEKLVA